MVARLRRIPLYTHITVARDSIVAGAQSEQIGPDGGPPEEVVYTIGCSPEDRDSARILLAQPAVLRFDRGPYPET